MTDKETRRLIEEKEARERVKRLNAVITKVLAGMKPPDDLTVTEWAEDWMKRYEVGPENIHSIVQAEIGKVFAKVLECAGVYKRTEEGQAAFERFIRVIE